MMQRRNDVKIRKEELCERIAQTRGSLPVSSPELLIETRPLYTKPERSQENNFT
jgi:hypothetical protein